MYRPYYEAPEAINPPEYEELTEEQEHARGMAIEAQIDAYRERVATLDSQGKDSSYE